ncbi:hypothetical protein Hanom_Chr13g01231481 [Helianthus anomalus]
MILQRDEQQLDSNQTKSTSKNLRRMQSCSPPVQTLRIFTQFITPLTFLFFSCLFVAKTI